MSQPDDGAAGFDIELLASLDVNLGRVADQLAYQRDRHESLNQSVKTIPNIVAPQLVPVSSAGTIDAADILGPKTGQCWDVKRMTAATFAAGTVTVYRDAQADQNELYVFSQAGSAFFGSLQVTLEAGERLIVVGAGLTGNVTFSFGVIEVAAPWWPAYVL